MIPEIPIWFLLVFAKRPKVDVDKSKAAHSNPIIEFSGFRSSLTANFPYLLI